jgi:hypothetical protein
VELCGGEVLPQLPEERVLARSVSDDEDAQDALPVDESIS